ncbi:MAG TPA: response regulator [Pyrinomonadaceae bacterium]|jgi:DNA-binding response OmpR family regulator
MQNAKIRILFADDHEDIRLMVSILLGASDYEVITADSIDSALALARDGAFDVYLLDNRLPDGTGRELCERLREFDRVTPIIFFSGEDRESERQRVLSCGAQDYVEKPNVRALPKAIAGVLRSAQAAH